MAYANKFLDTGAINVSDGSQTIFGLKIGAKNLKGATIDTVKIDGSGFLYAGSLNAGDVSGVVANPMTTDLDLGSNDIINASTVEVSNGVNSMTLNYTSGIIDQSLDLQDIKDIDNATQNIKSTTTVGQTDIDGDVVIDGDLQFGGSLIGSLVINDVNITSQTSDLSVDVSNFPATQTVDGTVNVGNFPATQTVDGSVSVDNFPGTQTVAGTVNVGNFPGTQTVAGTVNVGNFPGTQTVAGTVNVGNLPSTQDVNVTNTNVSVTSGGVNLLSETTGGAIKTATETTATNSGLIDGKIPTKGQKAASGSIPVVLTAGYDSTTYVATDGGSFVEVGINSAFSSGSQSVKLDQVLNNALLVDAGATGPGAQRVVLSNDYSSTVINRPLFSSMYYEKFIDNQNFAINHLANFVYSFGGWLGAPNPVYLAKVYLLIYVAGNVKMEGWGTGTTPITGGFWIYYKQTQTDTNHELFGSNGRRIVSLTDVVFESDDYQSEATGRTAIRATIDLSNNPVYIDNAGPSSEGSLRIDVLAGSDLTLGSTTEMYFGVGYYRS